MNTLESYQPEKLKERKRKSITRPTEDWVVFEFDPNAPQTFTPEQEAEIEALAEMPDSEIDYSDIPPLEERERNRTHKITLGNPWITPPTKSVLDGFLIDSDIIHWVLHQVGGDGYMDKMNAMLRRAMDEERAAQQRADAS